MIRALRACLRHPGPCRVVGLVALLAFVLVVALGAMHVGEKGDPAHDHCGVCVAVAAVGTSESYAAPQLVAHVDDADPAAFPGLPVPVAAEPRRSHAPRGPPSLA